jgi:hypothetical protein
VSTVNASTGVESGKSFHTRDPGHRIIVIPVSDADRACSLATDVGWIFGNRFACQNRRFAKIVPIRLKRPKIIACNFHINEALLLRSMMRSGAGMKSADKEENGQPLAEPVRQGLLLCLRKSCL